MTSNETVAVVVLILAAVIVVALIKFSKVRAKLHVPGIGGTEIAAEREKKPLAEEQTKKRIHKSRDIRPWFSRHWRAVAIGSSILLIVSVSL